MRLLSGLRLPNVQVGSKVGGKAGTEASPPLVTDRAESGEPLVAAALTASFHRISTAQGTWMAAGAEPSGRHITMQADDGTLPAVYALVPDSNRQRCFLVAADGAPLSVLVDGLSSVAVSALRLVTDAPGLVRLKHPLSPLHYLGIADADRPHPGELVFDTLGQTMLCVFGLLPVAPNSVPGCVREIATELALACAPPPRAAVLLAQLASGTVRPALAETLLRLLPPDELQLLALRLLDDFAALSALQSALPGDIWLNEVFPALSAWRVHREPVAGGVLASPLSDQFAAEPFEGISRPQAGMALVALARRQTGPRRGACILATVRNEGPYLLDWIAYHLSIGFEHIFLYTNDNEDGSEALLEALASHGVVTLVHNRSGTHVGPQYKAYAHALLLLPQILDYRWTAVIDADEYIGFDTTMFADFGEFIAWQETQPVDAIALCWLIHAADPAQGYTAEATPERFPLRDPQVNWHVKSLFRTRDFWQSQAHFPRATLDWPFVYRSETGVLHHHHGVEKRIPAHAAVAGARLAWVSHYMLRSAPEALWKMARGRADWNAAAVVEREVQHAHWLARTFMGLAEPGKAIEDRRIVACGARKQAMLARLLALPGVAEIDARLKRDFARLLEGVVQRFLASPRNDWDPPEMDAFRDIIERNHAR